MKAQPTTTVVVDFALDLSGGNGLIAYITCPTRAITGGYLPREHHRQVTVLKVLADARSQRCGQQLRFGSHPCHPRRALVRASSEPPLESPLNAAWSLLSAQSDFLCLSTRT